MTHVIAARVSAVPAGRPRPSPRPVPGDQVAPRPVEEFSPWAAVLEQTEGTGDLRWVVGPDGVLLPTRQPRSATTMRSTGRPLRNRLAALIGRRR